MARRFYRALFPPERPPFAMVDSATLFPNLYHQDIALGRLDLRWGDMIYDGSLLFLCALARNGYAPIVEFGTFRGRTAYNLALNCAGPIITIDIGPDMGRTIDVGANIERHQYDPYETGEVFCDAPEAVRRKIEQIIGDSTQLDLSHLYGTIGMVFVDGGHSYEVCKSDSEKALRLVREGGVVVWDDYRLYWPGVKRALDELSSSIKLYYLLREGLVVHGAGLSPGTSSSR